ncbi:hypothetical protein [Hippea alviniae]|nr:hypothetical protein [Hippea alviniae]
MINVARPYLPQFDKYINKIKELWDNHWITNNGKFVQELEEKLKDYLK